MAHPAPPTSAMAERVSPKAIERAVSALLKWRSSNNQNVKPELFDGDDEFVYLILTLKKIPPKDRVNPHKILLPHSLFSEFSELCLIIDDRPKASLTKDDALKKIKSENIPVSTVLKLSKLKSDYRPFEAKRKLCDSYNMIFADKRVIPLLPRLLGKQFFKKKKIPVPLDLKHKNWKEQIEKACLSALLFLRTGTCSVVRVAKVGMKKDEIVDNVVAAINGIVEVVPKKWKNVRSFHVKLLESLALPIYQAVPDMNLKIEGVKDKENYKEIGEDGAEKDLKVGKKKGRIHQVRYMDNNASEEFSEGSGSEGDAEERNDTDAGLLVDKKRKKASKNDGALSELNGVKRLRKSAKNKNMDVVKQKKDELVLEENVLKQKKNELPVEDGESGNKKKSGLKSKDGDMKVKAKKSKKAA